MRTADLAGSSLLSKRAAAILAQFPGPVTLRPSTLKWLMLLVGNALFALGSAVMSVWLYLQDGPTVLMLTFCALGLTFVMIGSAAMFSFATAGMWARLDVEGFETRDVWGCTKRRNWSDTDGFAVLPINFSSLVVYSDTKPADGWWDALNRPFIGGKSFLPDTCGLRARDFAELMTAWRQRALAQPADSN
jgi:hypothetical protein